MTAQPKPIQLSPLQLRRYFVTRLTMLANQSYDVKKGLVAHPSDFKVRREAAATGGDQCEHQITLSLQVEGGADSNLPYSLSAEIVGVITASPQLQGSNRDRLIANNGASMLFGILREVVRSTTSHGPFRPLLLPTLCFLEPGGDDEKPTPRRTRPQPRVSP